MRFINRSNNTVRLDEINRNIPYLGDKEQDITADEIKKSSLFQNMCLSNRIEIVGDCNERIEMNLLQMQNGVKVPPEPEPIEVSVKGHFYTNTGYGKANRNFVFGLLRTACKVGIEPFNRHAEGLNELEITQLNLLCRIPSDKAVVINSSIPTFAETSYARYSIMYTTVESVSIPQQFVDACEPYHEIWTPSNFCKEILESSGLSTPVYVIPNAVNPGTYNTKVKPHVFNPKMKDFVFVSVFGWNYRKGYDALIKAYLKAFNGNDNVSLLIVTKYEYGKDGTCKIEDEIRSLIKEYGGSNPAHIARCGRNLPEFEMPRLYRACHCFVLPSRGEGFGLPYIEASLCGLPVIATDHSGHTMFLNNKNSHLVEIDDIDIMEDGKTNVHYWDGQLFPKLTSPKFLSSLGEAMLDVYKNHSKAVGRNENLRLEILETYTPEKIGIEARERLDAIWSSL